MVVLLVHAAHAQEVKGSSTSSASFTRSGSDRITGASLPGSGDVAPAYDATCGYVTGLDGAVQSDLGNSYSLSYEHDPYTGKLLTQALVQTRGTDVRTTLLNAASSYDARGRRISRTVDGGQMSPASVSTNYWYGQMQLKPLFVERALVAGDGAASAENGRIIYVGDDMLAIESGPAGDQAAYLVTDHLGSTRVVLDAGGDTQASFSYDGEWGKTVIDGQDSAVDTTSLSTLFRFQGIEQEAFPLTALGIDNADALAWLDGIGQYHYFGREYAAGLAAFLAIDPAASSVSPYSAFGENPANLVDPDGMAWRSALGRRFGATDEFDDFIAHMRRAGIRKVLVSEVHQEANNLDIVGRILKGAAQDKGGFKFWMEYADPRPNFESDAARSVRWFAKATKAEPRIQMANTLASGLSPIKDPVALITSESYSRFEQAMLMSGTELDLMIFISRQRDDMSNFIQYPGFAVANMGRAHAEFSYAGQMLAYIPWLHARQRLPQEYTGKDEEKLTADYNGFKRALEHAPDAMLVISGASYSPHDEVLGRAAALSYYKKNGYAVAEFPLSSMSPAASKGYNVTIVAPAGFAPAISEYIEKMYYPETVNFECSGMEACPKAKEEL